LDDSGKVDKTMQYDLKGRVIIITAADSGVGKATAIRLARLGGTVLLACCSKTGGLQALDEVRCAAESSRVEMMQVDISFQYSIRRFVADFKQRYDHLHVLIHSAASFDPTQKKPVLTPDGLETVFATNHLGPFLMTYLLLDMLKDSAPSQVITTASNGLISYPSLDIEFDNLYGERKFNVQHAYYHSRQAQVMFTLDLAERLRGTGVNVNCVRLGNVAISEERLAHLPKWIQSIYRVKRKFSVSLGKMAEIYVWLAADPVGGQQTGGYWDAPGLAARANENAYNKETQRRLWAVSALFTRIPIHDLD
jgi:NAD(P)-dependent dehydrogenase (short-subunit alcohol dehydrogenase family)